VQTGDPEPQDELDREDPRVTVDKRVNEDFQEDPEGRVVAEEAESLVCREVLDYRASLGR